MPDAANESIPPLVLVVDDEAAIRKFLRVALTANGYRVVEAETARGALSHAATDRPDVMILDLGLPDGDGIDVVRQVREWNAMPIVIVSARGQERSKVAALDAGADDYLTKPFDFPELEARLHALLRRSRPGSAAQQLRGLTLDRAARRASIGGEPVELSPREWTLLDLLLQERDRVVTKQQIVEAWGADEGGSIEVYIHRLRKKLEGSGLAVRTVRGLGYLLEASSTP